MQVMSSSYTMKIISIFFTVEYSMCVCVFLSCEITSKTKMIVVTEAWVLCEIDLTVFLQMWFLFSVWLGLGLGQIKKLLYNGKDRERSYKSELQSCVCVCVCVCVIERKRQGEKVCRCVYERELNAHPFTVNQRIVWKGTREIYWKPILGRLSIQGAHRFNGHLNNFVDKGPGGIHLPIK